MRNTRLRHALAVVTAAAVLASMTAATVASPASAAKPKCQGKTATIVGTGKGERIVGTARRDVIVAKGGADRIYGRGGNDLICAGTGNDLVVGGPGADTLWGQLGNDRLHGGPGNDFLAGQVGNDTLNGGLNFDTCFQGTGVGLVTNCELPAPPPPPPPPEARTLVVAYVDVNTNHGFDTGDVVIAKIIDTNKDNIVSAGDTIKMGQYPTSPSVVKPAVLRNQLEDWKVKEHPVTSVDMDATADVVRVQSGAANREFYFIRNSAVTMSDQYIEANPTGISYVIDDATAPTANDIILTQVASMSQPTSALTTQSVSVAPLGDDGFIDVDFVAGV